MFETFLRKYRSLAMLQRGDMRGPDQTDCSCPREEMMRPELRPVSGTERKEARDTIQGRLQRRLGR